MHNAEGRGMNGCFVSLLFFQINIELFIVILIITNLHKKIILLKLVLIIGPGQNFAPSEKLSGEYFEKK